MNDVMVYLLAKTARELEDMDQEFLALRHVEDAGRLTKARREARCLVGKAVVIIDRILDEETALERSRSKIEEMSAAMVQGQRTSIWNSSTLTKAPPITS